MLKRACLIAFAAAILCCVTPRDSRAEYAPQVGQRHDDFLLPSLADWEPIALSQFRGRKVLLIHFASW